MIFVIALFVTIISIIGCINIKKPSVRFGLGIVAVFGLLIVVLTGSFTYVTTYKINAVASSVSPDGKFELFFQQIGDPDWPFGYTHARLVLKDESGTIAKYSFNVANDGANVGSKNWQVTWKEDCVEAVISGEEQNDDQYILFFNGKTNFNQLDSKYGKTAEEDESESENYHEIEGDIKINSKDYSDLFSGLNGCAVIYNFDTDTYYVYNEDQMDEQYSPLSTFKIVSTLMGLRSGVLENTDSKMGYEGMNYPVEQWNDNLSLKEAFESSCVWYFRKVIDAVGMSEVQSELDSLHYGNCDISEWNGSGINPMADLNGFWLGSSLRISPLEQVKVMKTIWGGESIYTDEEISILQNIMLYDEINDYSIYGKTGTTHSEEGWYVGIATKKQNQYCFAIHIINSESDRPATGNEAREIVKKIFEMDDFE